MLDAPALNAVLAFIINREQKLQSEAEYAVREAKAQELVTSLQTVAEQWSEEESFDFDIAVRGLPLRSADAEANAREARLFASMLNSLSTEDKINALLNAAQGRDSYVVSALRMVKTLVAAMTWEQERAFDIGLMARYWEKHERLEQGELAAFILALIEKTKTADVELSTRIAEQNERLSKETP